ncbi:hypothetical protein O1611_g5897 [Lasiodiplodia mahajangana]|uniref:Uncharacterized protein n=1 Tax=Lasiodiplodia mahajangana TaxID=1108764 RepID=A0ACC2JKI7_9PEZI|nr:hypothetical protein O1611_g5897 [Lasiodiplodia mahajangana]
MYLKVAQVLRQAGLQPPNVNVNVLWTAVDGPDTIRKVKCDSFSIDKCLGDSFASPLSDETSRNPDFAVSSVFGRLSHAHPSCGDCLLKFALAAVPRGLEPLLPSADTKPKDRDVIIRALKKYQHTIVDTDTMKFFMVKDAEQAKAELLERTIERGTAFGQWCFNDDVMTESPEEVDRVRGINRSTKLMLAWASRESLLALSDSPRRSSQKLLTFINIYTYKNKANPIHPSSADRWQTKFMDNIPSRKIGKVLPSVNKSGSDSDGESPTQVLSTIIALPAYSIHLTSPAIIDALRSVVQYYPTEDLTGNIVVNWPGIAQFGDRVRKADERELWKTEKRAYKDLGLLLRYLDKSVMSGVHFNTPQRLGTLSPGI